MKAGILFGGGGGVEIGLSMLGVDIAWSIEYDEKIANVAKMNFDHNIIVANILDVDPRTLPTIDWLHASPPCPSFSVAKTGAEETENDISLAQKIAEFITVLKPHIFTLENVTMYRKSKSWGIVEKALASNGYFYDLSMLNFADYGVPQNRRRMIVRAVRGGLLYQLPPKQPRLGWYQAIEDLIPDLKETTFAPWQLARLPQDIIGHVVVHSGNNAISEAKAGNGVSFANEAINSIAANHTPGKIAMLVQNTFKTQNGKVYKEKDETAQAVVVAQQPPTIFIFSNTNASTSKPVDAFVMSGQDAKTPFPRNGVPSSTVVASESKGMRTIYDKGKVLKANARCLARWQTFPDWYKLPDKVTLAARVIGNAVPPVGFANVVRNMII